MPRAGSSELPSACCAWCSLLYQERAARVPCQCNCGSWCYMWAACRLPSCACHVSLQSDGAAALSFHHDHSGDALLVFCRRPGAAACADKRLCAAAIGAGSAAAVRANLAGRHFGRRSCAERRQWWAGRALAGAAISVQISGEGGCLAARAIEACSGGGGRTGCVERHTPRSLRRRICGTSSGTSEMNVHILYLVSARGRESRIWRACRQWGRRSQRQEFARWEHTSAGSCIGIFL